MKNETKNTQETQSNKHVPQPDPAISNSNTVKDPNDWTTGGEPMTGAQQSYLKTLSDQAGEEVDNDLTKADAPKRLMSFNTKPEEV